MNGPQAGSGISGRMLMQAVYLGAASFWLTVVASLPGMSWVAGIVPWLWGMAVPCLGVAAGFRLRDLREAREAGLHKFRADVIRELEAQQAMPPRRFHYHELSRGQLVHGVRMPGDVLEACEDRECRKVLGRWLRPSEMPRRADGWTDWGSTLGYCERHEDAEVEQLAKIACVSPREMRMALEALRRGRHDYGAY